MRLGKTLVLLPRPLPVVLAHLEWEFPKGFTTGKATVDKMNQLLAAYAQYVDEKHDLGFGRVAPRIDGTAKETPEFFDLTPMKTPSSEPFAVGTMVMCFR